VELSRWYLGDDPLQHITGGFTLRAKALALRGILKKDVVNPCIVMRKQPVKRNLMSDTTNMPKKLHEVYKLLEDELILIHVKWTIYSTVFGHSKDRIDLLNEFAPITFGIFQKTLLDDIILSINRLIDPKKSRSGKECVSFDKLISAIATKKQGPLKKTLKSMLKDINNSCKEISKIRRTRIAHNDLVNLKVGLKGYKIPSRKLIRSIIAKLDEFMNQVLSTYDHTEIFYDLNPQVVTSSNLLIMHFENLRKFYDKFGFEYFALEELNNKE